jgi:phosphoglycolate phosphatase
VRGPRRLFLFDIDGTLVTAAGAGRAALSRALLATYGVTGPIDAYDFRGKTDPRIVSDLMRGAGLEDARIVAGLSACYAAYVAELEAVIGDGSRLRVMPGVAELVRALAGRDDAVLGLLTGNIRDGARVKLAPTGLWPLFPIGAFGSDDMDRRRRARTPAAPSPSTRSRSSATPRWTSTARAPAAPWRWRWRPASTPPPI